MKAIFQQFLAKGIFSDYIFAVGMAMTEVYSLYLLKQSICGYDPMTRQSVMICCMAMLSLLFQSAAMAAVPSPKPALQWQAEGSWKISGKPLDIAHSLDGKYAFILNDEQQVLVYTSDGKLVGKIAVQNGVSAIDIAPRGESLYLLNEEDNSFTTLSVSFVANIDIKGSPFVGKEDAPVTVVVFTDFQCPHCSKVVPLLEDVLDNNPDSVKVVLKNMPLSFHEMALPAALAAIAAGKQGKFWEYHDELFATAKLDKNSFILIAKKLGLDLDKFKNDMNSTEVQQHLAKDLRDAQEAGVTGTPTIFINGIKLTRRDLPTFQKRIDAELAQ